MNNMFTYQFEVSQTLTEYQVDFLNRMLLRLPTRDKTHLMDVPEEVTELQLVNKG